MLAKGANVADVKATMVESTDILGGFAVPVDVSNQVIRRLRGLTAVRGAGATVVQTAGKSIEWLKVTGGNGSYTGNIRGAWGSETQSPGEQNMTFGSLNIPVNVYTYKMPLSTSLLEDATNLTELFTMEVAEALALDEDDAFLTGDGANKPYGILPGGANGRSLGFALSGSSGALAINGLKALRREVASQIVAAMLAS
jgi:HK97 family phage major capsid protein